MKIAVLIGAGEFAKNKFIDFIAKNEQVMTIAVDNGYNYIKNLCNIHKVVGDFDSLGYVPSEVQTQTFNPEKDYTDMALALDCAIESGATKVFVFGALGGRLDHTLANLQLFSAKSHLAKIIAIGVNESVYFVTDHCEIEGYIGQTLSVFAMQNAEGLTYSGLKYPLDNYTMLNTFPIGVSNQLQNTTATIDIASGAVIVIVNDKID